MLDYIDLTWRTTYTRPDMTSARAKIFTSHNNLEERSVIFPFKLKFSYLRYEYFFQASYKNKENYFYIENFFHALQFIHEVPTSRDNIFRSVIRL